MDERTDDGREVRRESGGAGRHKGGDGVIRRLKFLEPMTVSLLANRRRDLENQQKDLKAREDKLAKDGAVMAEAERRNAEKALRDGQRELARKQNEFLEDLNVRRNEALGQLQRTVLQEVQGYARTAGFDVVVADALYASQSVDITNQVLAALQARKAPAPAAKP